MISADSGRAILRVATTGATGGVDARRNQSSAAFGGRTEPWAVVATIEAVCLGALIVAWLGGHPAGTAEPDPAAPDSMPPAWPGDFATVGLGDGGA